MVNWILYDIFPYEYSKYSQHIIIADENYFQTILMNSPFCDDIVTNNNHLFVIFDDWEHVKRSDLRDSRKCLLPDPNSCGRSPAILTMKHKNLLSVSSALYARKFDNSNDLSLSLLNEIDTWLLDNYTKQSHSDEGIEFSILQTIHDQVSCLTSSSDASLKMSKCQFHSIDQRFMLGMIIRKLIIIMIYLQVYIARTMLRYC